MPRRHRLRRIAKWTGLGACVAVAAVWIAGVFVQVRWYTGTHRFVSVFMGNLCLIKFTGKRQYSSDIVFIPSYYYRKPDGIDSLALALGLWNLPGVSSDGELIVVPFWLLLASLALPTGLLFYLDRKRPPPGHCQSCGYDLTGNTSGRCPECGSAVEAGISEESG